MSEYNNYATSSGVHAVLWLAMKLYGVGVTFLIDQYSVKFKINDCAYTNW